VCSGEARGKYMARPPIAKAGNRGQIGRNSRQHPGTSLCQKRDMKASQLLNVLMEKKKGP